jgi:hypothetical protein
MDEKQFEEIRTRRDKVIALLSIQGLDDIGKKINILKKLGLNSNEIGDILGIANVRQMKEWKEK